MASSRVFSSKTPLFQAAQEPVGLSQCRCSQELKGGSPFTAAFFLGGGMVFEKSGPFLVGSDFLWIDVKI